ncbi:MULTISPECIES: hypothetical protein [Vagococcus]|uniref:hypothetical protein n=1 Tax=Vagococcus TaxID=2737 RepID=UPI0013148369|nr:MULTISPECIES: hypothetical protein [Vagococcus]
MNKRIITVKDLSGNFCKKKIFGNEKTIFKYFKNEKHLKQSGYLYGEKNLKSYEV